MSAIAIEVRAHHFDPVKLAAARDRAGLTQPQAAAKLKMHFMSLSRIENGHRTKLQTLRRLCDLYGIPIQQVLVPGSHLCDK
jgi:transcriptional regulator with XRE-family HTH domain